MSMTASVETTPRLRLDFLDGLRGLAAFYLATFHCFVIVYVNSSAIPHWASLVLKPLSYGQYSVAVFIVLSGFCLMLPVVRSPDGRLRGGWRAYLQRRAIRILPPYYAAFAIASVLLLLATHFKHRMGVMAAGEHLTPSLIISHLFLVHNWSPLWNKKVDGPLWSVATEWQIYFFLPFILLPLWRRFGLVLVVFVAFALGLIPHFLLSPSWNFDWACPWYLGLFSMGLAGAVIGTSLVPKMQALRKKLPWGVFTVLLAATFFVKQIIAPDYPPKGEFSASHTWPIDTLCGLMTMCLLIFCTNCAHAGGSWVTKVLQSRPAMFLGAMSYSLYLMHVPVLQRPISLLCSRHLPFTLITLAVFVVVLPFTIGLCYLFHIVFERPFMTGHPRTERQAEIAAVLSPAP